MRRKTPVRFGERVGGNDRPQGRHRASDPTPPNLEPSSNDVHITRKLVAAGEILGIPILDHLIVTARGYTSLAERGLLR